MGFFRQILLILFLAGLSLAGLITIGTIFPDAFASGSGEFLLYVIGASAIFLLFLKRYRERGPSQRDKELEIEPAPGALSDDSPDKKLEEIRTRIRDRKKKEK
jgi:hypothetical protein